MVWKENLYFIAVIPPEEICNEITGFKKDFAKRFSSKAALKAIPHITLKAPFKLPDHEHAKLFQWFQHLFIPRESFQIALKDFEAFHNKYNPVVYVHPVMNLPLYTLQKEIIRNFRIAWPQHTITEPELKFKPHITIAYRDLRPEKFAEAWKEYKEKRYESIFQADSFHLMQHNGKMWNRIDEYSLRSS